MHDATIIEDIEDENTQMITGITSGKVGKSPSLPSSARSISVVTQPRTRSIAGLGMFRSMRHKPKYQEQIRVAEEDSIELQELHRRARSWNKRLIFHSCLLNFC